MGHYFRLLDLDLLNSVAGNGDLHNNSYPPIEAVL